LSIVPNVSQGDIFAIIAVRRRIGEPDVSDHGMERKSQMGKEDV